METRTPNGKGPAANVRRGGETKRRRSVRREMISGSSRSRSAQQNYIGPRRGGTPGNSVVDSASARQERIHSATRRAISLLVGFRAFSVDEDSHSVSSFHTRQRKRFFPTNLKKPYIRFRRGEVEKRSESQCASDARQVIHWLHSRTPAGLSLPCRILQ